MKQRIVAATLILAVASAAAHAQTYPDLGRALSARGYTASVWVNSFDPTQPYLAHGVFYPDTPFSPNGGYETRYGMGVTGSGTLSVDPNGLFSATGTAHNPNPITSDGSILIELLRDGNLADSTKISFVCPAASDCPWTAHFTTSSDSHSWSVRVRRHVEGARSGGERNIDLNGPCHDALVSYFQLPGSYVFTSTDLIDTNYVSKPGQQDSVLGTLLAPTLCASGPAQPRPVSGFIWSPAEVYPGTLVSFTDTSANVPTSWAWAFQAGSQSTSSAPNPQVSFSSIGLKTVTLQAGNTAGLGSVFSKTLTVLDPNPQGALSATFASLTQCQSVDFTASATGAPPLAYVWEVLDPNNATLNPPGRVPAGSTFTWTSLPGHAPGTYTARVTVSNSASPGGVVLSRQVQLTALPALTDISGAVASTNGFVSNAVQFTAPAYVGATQVVWDYGDGKTDTFTDPVAGRTPSHTYGAIGTYNAKVTISNCVKPAGSTSQTVSVRITQATALVASFRANDVSCQFGQCTFVVGQAVTFVDSSIGATFWDYDWTHASSSAQTCNFTDNDHTAPVTTHTFASTGTFYPCLRVRRGAGEQDPTVHAAINVTGGTPPPPPPPPPPSIAVSGPASGQVNQPYTFTGAASNCTPDGSGWSWSVSGGSISGGSGSSTGSSISVSWSAAGAKTVSATNSGCPGAQGTRTIILSDPVPPPSPQAQFSVSPAAPKASEVVSFDASSSTNVASGSSFGWDFGDGSTGAGPVVLHGFASAGSFNVRLTVTPPGCLNTGCSSQATKTVVVAPNGGPKFTVSPASPGAGEGVTFDSGPSTLIAPGSLFGWDFGDGSSSAFGQVVTHTFAQQGSYRVVLAVAPSGCASVACLAVVAKTVAIGPPPPVLAEFTTDVPCNSKSGGDECQAQTGKTVALTASAGDASTYSWSFGDGTVSQSRKAYHAWAAPGSYTVTLTLTKGTASATKTRTFVVTGPPPPKNKTVLLPSVFESRGPLVESNDLYVYNPGTAPLDVTVEFRKQGLVEDNPPRVPATIAPGATLFVPDVLLGFFNLQDVAGFITVTASSETVEPVVTAFDSRGQTPSQSFGAAIAGSSFDASALRDSSTPGTPQYLVGLSDSADRQGSFSFTNPSDQPATYQLRLFDQGGHLLGESAVQDLDRHGKRQFEVQEIRDLFGVSSLKDYRVEVASVAGPQVFPFGSDVRLSTGDLSFTRPGSYTAPTAYLLGVVSGQGGAGSALQTDLLLSNVGDQPVQTSVKLTRLGAKASSPRSAQVLVQPGETQRLENVLLGQFALRNGIGVLTVTSTSPTGIYPIVEAESYDNSDPQKRFGQGIVALSDADAADSSQKLLLVGLRQDGLNKTTLWLFNPSGGGGEYDLVYRDLSGAVLGTIRGVKVGAGQMRQFLPGQHPLPKTGVPNGLSVEVVVKSGKALAAAQVVRSGSNDPAYIPGVVR